MDDEVGTQEVVVDYIDMCANGCVLVTHAEFMSHVNRELQRMAIIAHFVNHRNRNSVHFTIHPKPSVSQQTLLHRLTQRFTPRMRAAHAYFASSPGGNVAVGIKFTLVQIGDTQLAELKKRFLSECDKSGLGATSPLEERCSIVAQISNWSTPAECAKTSAEDLLTPLIDRIKAIGKSAGIFVSRVVMCPPSQSPTTALVEEMRKPFAL